MDIFFAKFIMFVDRSSGYFLEINHWVKKEPITDKASRLLQKIRGKFGCYERSVISLIEEVTDCNLSDKLNGNSILRKGVNAGLMLYYKPPHRGGKLMVVTHVTPNGVTFMTEDGEFPNYNIGSLTEKFREGWVHVATDIPTACKHFNIELIKRHFRYLEFVEV